MKRSISIVNRLMLLIAVTHCVSCSNLSPANKSLYAFDLGKPATSLDASPAAQIVSGNTEISRDQVLQVRRVSIAPPFDGSTLVYRTPNGTFEKDYYNEWLASPEELLSTETVDYLSATGAFPAVVDARSDAPHRYVLDVCITELYGDFHDSRHPEVVLSARYYILDAAAGQSDRIALQDRCDISIPLSGATAQQMVIGSGGAFRQLLESIDKKLRTLNQNSVVRDAR